MSHDSGCSVCGERSVHFNCGHISCPKPGKWEDPTPSNIVTDFHEMVERFNREIIGLTIPREPTRLSPGRKDHALDHMREELDEFGTSTTIDDEVDALLDLVYVALGRIVEMGVAPRPVFEEVQAANMRKHRGTVAKRPNSAGHDAVKPEDWTPPDLTPYLTLTKEMVDRHHQADTVLPNFAKNLEDRVTLETVMKRVFPWLEHLSHVHEELAELRMKKGQDYNVGGPTIPAYFPFGHKSYAQMVHVKSLRIQSLLAVADVGRTPNFEGLRDTLMDILNYATFYIEALDRGDLGGDEPPATAVDPDFKPGGTD